jgi:tRNA/tmRNA/rRNA uracil-C5-methylase (TrmA/RlmC/RlmD family)
MRRGFAKLIRMSSSSSSASAAVDLDFVHPLIVVPTVARLTVQRLPSHESKDWTAKALRKAGVSNFTSVKKVNGHDWARVTFASDADRDAALNTLRAVDNFGNLGRSVRVEQTRDSRDKKPVAAGAAADEPSGAADALSSDEASGDDAGRVSKRARTGADESATTTTGGGSGTATTASFTVESAEKRVATILQPWHDVPYAEQVERKLAQLRENLKDMTAGAMAASAKTKNGLPRWLARKSRRMLPCVLRPLLPTDAEFVAAYRNKFTFTIGKDQSGAPVVGNVVSGLSVSDELALARPLLPSCGVPARVEAVRAELERLVLASPLPVHHSKSHTGFWRGCLIRALSTNVVMLVVWVCRAGISERQVQAELQRLAQRCTDASLPPPPWHSLAVQFHEGVNNTMPDDAPGVHLFGPAVGYEELLGMRFRISPQSFFQVNHNATTKLYGLLRSMCTSFAADGGRDTVVLDVCCGTGTIGLLIAPHVSRVVGIEMVADAVEDAKHNAEINGITNAEFIVGKVEDVLKSTGFDRMVAGAKQVVAVLDPPRAGLHATVLRALRACSVVTHIIYVSCCQASLVRDAPLLWQSESNGMRGRPFYPLEAVGVDLFPNTDLVELVVSMQRSGTDDEEAARLAAEDAAAAKERAEKQAARDALTASNKET